MSKVRSGAPRSDNKSSAPAPHPEVREVSVTSVIFGLTLIAATLVAGAAWMGGSLTRMEQRMGHWMDSTSRSLGFAIEHIVIAGVSEEIDDEIRSAILIEPGENMFRADPQKLREQVEATRLVVNVRVNRFWPNRVFIVANPLEPVALLKYQDGFAAIDSLGGAARIELPNEQETLLRISGAGATQAVTTLIEELEPFPGLEALVSSANRVADRRWDLELTTGHIVRLPDDDRVAETLVRLDDVHTDLSLLDRAPAVIDMRSGERMFIKRLAPLTAALDAGVEGG